MNRTQVQCQAVRAPRDFAAAWHAVPLLVATLLAALFVLAGGG